MRSNAGGWSVVILQKPPFSLEPSKTLGIPVTPEAAKFGGQEPALRGLAPLHDLDGKAPHELLGHGQRHQVAGAAQRRKRRRLVQPHELCRRYRRAEGAGGAGGEKPREGVPGMDGGRRPVGRLVARDDGGDNVLAAFAVSLGQRQRRRDHRGAGVVSAEAQAVLGLYGLGRHAVEEHGLEDGRRKTAPEARDGPAAAQRL